MTEIVQVKLKKGTVKSLARLKIDWDLKSYDEVINKMMEEQE